MTIRLTPGDLAAAALWLHCTETGNLTEFINEHYATQPDVKQPPTWDECVEWEMDYGDMARELAAAIPRLVEEEADRRVTKTLKGETQCKRH